MAATTTVKTIGSTGVFSTLQLWEDGAPANLVTAERSATANFLVATFIQGENLNFVGSGATGKMLDTDSTGVGTGTYMTYGITAGNPAAADVITGVTSTATCTLTSGTPDFTGVIWQGQCQNQEFSSAGNIINFAGSTVNTTAYKELTTVAGASFRDNANVQTNALRYNSANGCGLTSSSAANYVVDVNEDNVHIGKLQIAATGTFGGGIGNTGVSIFADFLIVEGKHTGATDAVVTSVSSNSDFRNCLIMQRASAADHIILTNTGSPKFFNCTIVAPDDLAVAPTSIFLSTASGTLTVENCSLFAGDSTKAIKAGSATYNFTTCYSDISGTANVTQTAYSGEFENVNDATRDLRLKNGAAQINQGTTDVASAAIDIAGTARPRGSAYDVGCWEKVNPRPYDFFMFFPR